MSMMIMNTHLCTVFLQISLQRLLQPLHYQLPTMTLRVLQVYHAHTTVISLPIYLSIFQSIWQLSLRARNLCSDCPISKLIDRIQQNYLSNQVLRYNNKCLIDIIPSAIIMHMLVVHTAGVGGLNPSGVPVSAGVVGGAVGAVVVIVLMVVAVVVVIALVLQYKRQRTDSEALEMKNKEPFYETIRTGKPQNINSVGVPYRGSVYTDFEGTVTLQPNLESKTSAQV